MPNIDELLIDADWPKHQTWDIYTPFEEWIEHQTKAEVRVILRLPSAESMPKAFRAKVDAWLAE